MSLDDPDLFGAAAADGGAGGGGAASLPPLAMRMRPRGINEVRGQGDVLRPGSPLRRLIEGSGGAISANKFNGSCTSLSGKPAWDRYQKGHPK